MTENPLKEKIKQAFIENDRLQKELGIALDNWTASLAESCKRMGAPGGSPGSRPSCKRKEND